MRDLLSFAAVSFSAVFFVVDSIGLVPVFLAVTRIAIVHRVMGLLLAAIAVQFVVDGIRAVFP